MLLAVLWLISLGGAFTAGVFAYRHRAQIRTFISGVVRGGGVIQTNFYNVAVRVLPIPGEGRDGGIDALDDGLLLANRVGAMWFVTGDRELQPLSLRVPINVSEFETDPYNQNTNLRQQFAVKDILVQHIPEGLRVLASYNYWHVEDDCYALRVSMMEGTSQEIRGSEDLQSRWRTVFESEPCRPLTLSPDGVHRNPTIGAGGRLVALSDDEVLVTVGGFGPEGQTTQSANIQSPDNSYGKTILIDVRSGATRIYTLGHRNPQGLSRAPDGTIWMTDHGARGGDELNRVVDGRNYGFPVVSYGTEYELMTWRPSPRQGRHEGFEKPVYAWVPSIGISQLVVLEGKAFPNWEGDLLVSSMNGRSLFRVHHEDGRAIVVEPIPVDHRVRDLAELNDGTVALKTDDDFLVFLRPIDDTNMEELSPALRGSVVASACTGCHAFTPDGTDGIGPSLWGLVGRDVASRRGFAYSPALSSLGGEWSRDRIRAYITNPDSVAPGTLMAPSTAYAPESLDDLMAYLESLR